MRFIKEVRPVKIAVFRALQLGDMLCAVPAIRALKAALPQSSITLIGLPWAKSFVERFHHYFSGFIPFPGYPGLPEQAYDTKAVIAFLQEVVSRQFDLVIQMHGNGSVINPLVSLFNSRYTAGFYQQGSYCPDPALFIPYPETGSEIHRHVQMVHALGADVNDESLELPLFEEEIHRYEKLVKELKLKDKKYICVHAGARDFRRWWGAKNFSFVADKLCEKGYRIVLTGSNMEKEAVRMVESGMKSSCVNLAGETDLGTLALLIKNAKMLLSNDTGVSHVAAAMKTPSVVIFLISDPERWAPLNKELHKVILPEEAYNPLNVLMVADIVLKQQGSIV
ncbi:MAG TPA: glycosyltransferase family 9 protein [Cytophagaceae bacterium]